MADVLVIKYNHTIQGDCDQDVVFALVVTLSGQRGKKVHRFLMTREQITFFPTAL